ncbi:hypothetical protein [Tumebacillus permanentifrigoris]|uniref:Uncharacterized protein n=1 Tax=Tumebacillus permanentifrigoris TaxID=378543 RepID=A0A316DCE3_9BACL|nr:hypothetical protein [Tumebacillus permanentifrigoris]PWK15654.1 hypothetical protein C7459_103194 [Tumebacillus permanentifrigoris]
MNQAANDLLLAGLRLRNQHTAETFQVVIQLLQRRDQDPFLTDLFDLMRVMVEFDPTEQKRAIISEQDLERQDLLVELQELLRSRKVFPNKQQLTEFVTRKVPHLNPKSTIVEIRERYLKAIGAESMEEIVSELKLLKHPQRAQPKHQKEVDSFLRMTNRIVES